VSAAAPEAVGRLDELVLQLKGLVLVHGLRELDGADDGELAEYRQAIEDARDGLAAASMNLAARTGLSG
jgi:hypothetical protein